MQGVNLIRLWEVNNLVLKITSFLVLAIILGGVDLWTLNLGDYTFTFNKFNVLFPHYIKKTPPKNPTKTTKYKTFCIPIRCR